MRETQLSFVAPGLPGEQVRQLQRTGAVVSEAYDQERGPTRTGPVRKLNVMCLTSDALAEREGDFRPVRSTELLSVETQALEWDGDVPHLEDRDQGRRYCLELLHQGTLTFLALHGWEIALFEAAFAALAGRGVAAEFRGPWKRERESKRAVRVAGEVTEDGTSAWLELRTPEGVAVRAADLDLAWFGLAAVRHRARELRWLDSAHVLVRGKWPGGECPDLVLEV